MAACMAGLRSAVAIEVELELESGLTWTQSPVTLTVKVLNPENGMSAPQLSPLSGFEMRGPSGPTMQAHTINGRTTRFNAYGYQLIPLPGNKGRFTLGPASVRRRNGEVLKSKPVELLVYERPEVGLHMETTLTPTGGPVGSPFRVVYTIYYFGQTTESDDFFAFRRGNNAYGLSSIDLPVLGMSGVKSQPIATLSEIEADAVTIGNKGNVLVQRSSAEKAGKGYLTLVLAFEVTPLTTSSLELGMARASMKFATGRTQTGRDAFGFPVRVAEEKEYGAQSPSAVYQVRPLPTEGRPLGFNGAVGKYQITVTADPTEVDEGAPITLEVRVYGQGILEDLKPPHWTEIESLTKDFQVSGDVDGGKFENKAKVFRQIIRPMNAKVTVIPPVPFPYYDPALGKYQVTQSQPIPIKVRALQTALVDPGAQAAQPKAAAVVNTRAPQASTIVERGGVGANFESLGQVHPALDPRDELLSASFLLGVSVPPLLLAGCAVGLALRRRDPTLKRKSQALPRALSALSQAKSTSELASACENYFRDSLGLPAGELAPGEVAAALERAGAPMATRLGAAGLVEKAHAARFGAADGDATLAEEASRILKEVEACLHS